jgi:hypothetical protein
MSRILYLLLYWLFERAEEEVTWRGIYVRSKGEDDVKCNEVADRKKPDS